MSGFSVIENFCYGLYAIAAMLRSDRFPITTDDNKKNVHPKVVADKFAGVFRDEPVTQKLSALMGDQNYGTWKDMRNVLAHRASPGRHHSITLTVGREAEHGPSLWRNSRLDEQVTVDGRRWLASTLRSLLHTAGNFTTTRF